MMTQTTPPARRSAPALTAALTAALTLASGCGNYSVEDLLFKQAVPRAEDIFLLPPGAEALLPGQRSQGLTARGASQTSQALNRCGVSGLRCQAKEVAHTLNSLTWLFLSIIDAILQFDPSRREDDRRIWGPHFIAEDGNTFRFEMVRDPDTGSFRHCLHLARGRQGFGFGPDPMDCDTVVDEDTGLTRVLYGVFEPGADTGEAARSGRGTLVFDGVRATEAFGGGGDFPPGLFTITYDLSEDGAQAIDIDITGVVDEDTGLPTEAAYHYLRNADGSGDFSFSVLVDAVQPGLFDFDSALETMTIEALWLGSGAGRGEATVSGGDIDEGNAWQVVECWDRDLATTYFRDPDPEHEDIGSDEATDCVLGAPL